jgi:tricorn protease
MKNLRFIFLLAACLITAAVSGAEAWFVSSPSLSPDGMTVAFVYEGDIWVVPSAGGTAKRITAMEGYENNPRFSPDGKWIAFNGNKDGNSNIYIVPVKGGNVTQLSWHSTSDNIDSWSWDSKKIFFTSGRQNSFSAYTVAVDGGTPERLFSEHYWNNAHFVVQDNNTGTFYFSVSGESYRSSNRKRYKGENNPDILSYNPSSGDFRQITTWEGKDLWPTIDRNGTLYYASDEWNGEYNLYRQDGGKKVKLTSFESSIGRPQVSADGSKVVFTHDYQLWIYDTKTNSPGKISFDIFSTEPLPNEKVFNTPTNITAFDVSPDNKKLAFISRGELFVCDVKGLFIKKLNIDIRERALEVMWLNDNKTLLITRTWNGWPNLFTIAADGSSAEKQITTDDKSARMLVYDESRSLAAYYCGTDEFRIVDLKTLTVKSVAKDEFWFRGSPATFSPDLNYVAFTAFRNFEQDIMVCNLKTGEVINLTGTYLSEGSPFWSPDGKHIYFTADRTKASYPRGGGNNRLYRIPLQKYQQPLRSVAFDELFTKRENTPKPPIKIDLEDILFRWELVHNIPAAQSNPYVIMKDTLTTVLFTSSHEGSRKLYKLTMSPFDRNKLDEIRGVTGGSIATAKKEHYILSGGDIHKLNLNGNNSEKISINYTFTKDIRNEFVQMFHEGWTIMAENFYDLDMHGTDWKAVKARYEKFLPQVRTRSDLRILMNDMLGELNSSHMGFSSSGSEESISDNVTTIATGIIFSNSAPYTVDRVLKNSPADNINIDIKKGDRLVSVNGTKIDPTVAREYWFTFSAMPQEVVLGFEREGRQFQTRLQPVRYNTVNTLLYDEWIDGNQKYVDKASDKAIAYVYIKNMSAGSLNDFLIEMTSEAVDRQALIVDLRYNTGGNIHDDLINFLSQRPYLEWKFRDGQISPQPNFAPAGKPMVILINEQSLSDAEMTTAGLKSLNIGTIVGTETYRWIIFTSSKSLVDGSSCRLPAWGCYTLDGKNLESEGVKPDVYIKTGFPEKVKNEDPQLDKAIEILLGQIKEAGK